MISTPKPRFIHSYSFNWKSCQNETQHQNSNNDRRS